MCSRISIQLKSINRLNRLEKHDRTYDSKDIYISKYLPLKNTTAVTAYENILKKDRDGVIELVSLHYNTLHLFIRTFMKERDVTF